MVVIHDTNSLIRKVQSQESFNSQQDKTTIISVIEFPKIMNKEIGIFYPKLSTYNLAVNIAKKLFQNGTPVNSADIIIAAIAVEKQIPVRTADKHFYEIQEVEPKLVVEKLA